MRNFLTIIFTALAFTALLAQPLNRATTETNLRVAEEQFEKQAYYEALEYYELVYEENKDLDVAFKIARINENLRDYRKAVRWYKRIVNKRSRKVENPYMPEARYDYARMLKMNGEYSDAKQEFALYISESEDIKQIAKAKKQIEGCDMAMSMDEVPGLTIENAGKKVNSKYSEYSPVLVGDDEMIFTAINADEVIVIDDAKEDFHSKAFSAKKGEKGWGEPTPLGTNVNREGFHIGNLTVTPDGGTMYFTRALLSGSQLAESKLYVSRKSGNSWGAANQVEGVNGEYIVRQPAVGELFGNEVIFFSSNMDGGYGGYDLYYSTKRGDTYSPPVNLGEVINSDGDEETPFYRDGTLYFSSDGHVGIGGFDIFSSIWDGSVWSKPLNMGKGYNSSVDDLYFTIDSEGYDGFLVSNREGTKSVHGRTCCNDIWTVEKQKVVLQLVATTFANKEALTGATVVLLEMVDNEPGEPNSSTKENTNSFAFPLKRDMAYMVIGKKEGYKSDTTTFVTTGVKQSTTFEEVLNLEFIPVEPEYETYTIDQPIELENIYYDYDKWDILPDAEPDLTVIQELMNKYPDMVIELSSHTDSRGKTGYNKKLSQKRAESARSWLTERGIAEERIQAVGYGESQIRNKCVNGVRCDDDEHRYNRRTEFKIVAGPTSIQIEKTRLKKKVDK